MKTIYLIIFIGLAILIFSEMEWAVALYAVVMGIGLLVITHKNIVAERAAADTETDQIEEAK